MPQEGIIFGLDKKLVALNERRAVRKDRKLKQIEEDAECRKLSQKPVTETELEAIEEEPSIDNVNDTLYTPPVRETKKRKCDTSK